MKHGYRLLAVVLLATAAAGCGKKEKEEASPTATAPEAVPLAASALVTAETRTIQPVFEDPGIVEAIQQAEVHSEVAARLEQLHFSVGDIVAKGDLLAELDDSQYQTALSAAEAEVQSAKANAEQARTNWKRAEGLIPKGYISALDYDKAKATLGVAEAAVSKAKAQLERASLDVEHTRLYAPFGGRISRPRYALGDYVDPGGKALCEIVQLDPIYVTASIEQSSYNNYLLARSEMVKKGVEIPKLVLSLELAGGQTYPLKGEFENWSHSYTGSSGMIKGRARFPNPDGMLLPGQNVTIKGKSVKSIERVLVPQAAVQQDQQGHYVLVVDDSQTVQRRNLEMGVRDGADWAVRSGLEEGERVIVQGAQFMREGAKVSITDNN
jgi:RND family efflux transporter MFP subunit